MKLVGSGKHPHHPRVSMLKAFDASQNPLLVLFGSGSLLTASTVAFSEVSEVGRHKCLSVA